MRIITLTREWEDKVRQFMLGIIKNDFNYDYNPLWHKDIDDMSELYSRPRNIFLLAIINDEVIGTIAAREYDKTYPELEAQISNKSKCLGIWRHYIKKDLRNKGMGKQLYRKVEEFARKTFYSQLYLHTQRTIPGSLEYWLSRGFTIAAEPFDEFETVHLLKSL